MKKIGALVLSSVFVFIVARITFAQEPKQKTLEAIELLTGFGWGKLRVKDNYNLYSVSVNFDFNFKPLIKELNLAPRQLIQFQIEPYLAYVSSPDSNLETGTSFFFKAGILPQDYRIQPYVKVGVGLAYMTQHTREQATQFNFIDTAGIGLHYFFNKNTALALEGRFRHLSNASVKYPNSGINTYFVVGGAYYQF
jgi:opacity protein-like surface antigen